MTDKAMEKGRDEMFQRILVPLDGSKRAEQAIPLAARLARASGGSLVFVRAVDPLRTLLIYSPDTAECLQKFQEQEQADAADYLAGISALSECIGLERRCSMLSGPAPSSLLQAVQQEHIDLIVLCSHGYTGFKRWALGSVAQKVVRQSPVPVLLLREQNLNLTDKMAQPVRAVVALDGSPLAEAALRPSAHLVAALSSPAKGELLLVRVVQRSTAREERQCRQQGRAIDLRQAVLRAADDSLRAARAALLRELSGTAGVQIAWSVIEDGDVAEALIQAAASGKGPGVPASDLLALTTHGRSGIQRWVLGSVTERVLQGSTLPLLIVHSDVHSMHPAML